MSARGLMQYYMSLGVVCVPGMQVSAHPRNTCYHYTMPSVVQSTACLCVYVLVNTLRMM